MEQCGNDVTFTFTLLQTSPNEFVNHKDLPEIRGGLQKGDLNVNCVFTTYKNEFWTCVNVLCNAFEQETNLFTCKSMHLGVVIII